MKPLDLCHASHKLKIIYMCIYIHIHKYSNLCSTYLDYSIYLWYALLEASPVNTIKLPTSRVSMNTVVISILIFSNLK